MAGPSNVGSGSLLIVNLQKTAAPQQSSPIAVPAVVEKVTEAGREVFNSPTKLDSPRSVSQPAIMPSTTSHVQKAANGVLGSSPTSCSSPASTSPTKKPKNLLKSEGVEETLKTFVEFIYLIERTIEALNKPRPLPIMQSSENAKFLNSLKCNDEKAIEIKKPIMDQLAAGHIKRLTNFQTFLRGLVDEINFREIIRELKEIGDNLSGRNIQIKEEGTKGSITSNVPTSMLSNFCPSLKEAWEKLLEIEELNIQLKSLERKFSFIGNSPTPFEKEFRAAEVDKFFRRYHQCSLIYQINANLVGWENEELGKVRALADQRFKVLQKQVDLSPFAELKLSICTSAPDLEKIEKDFNEFIVFDPVRNIKTLYVDTLRLRVLVETESRFEVYRNHRSLWHLQRVKEWERLKSLMDSLMIGSTIEALKTLKDGASVNSADIQTLHEEIIKVKTLYDEKKKQIKE